MRPVLIRNNLLHALLMEMKRKRKAMKGVPAQCYFSQSHLKFPIFPPFCWNLLFPSSMYFMKSEKEFGLVARSFPFGLGDLPCGFSHFI